MKKLTALFSLLAIAATAFAQKAVVTGRFAQKPSPVMAIDMDNMMGERPIFDVADDGTFKWEFDVQGGKRYTMYFDEPHSGFVLYVEPGLKADLQIRFENSTVQGQEVTQCKIDYTGDGKDMFDFVTDHNYYEHQNVAIMAMQQNPKMSFSDYRALLRNEVDKGEAAFMKIGTPAFRKYMRDNYEKNIQGSMWWYMELGGQKDEQFAAFVESLDHNDPANAELAEYYASYYKAYNTPEGVDANLNLLRNVSTIFTDAQVAKAVATSTIATAMPKAPANLAELFDAYKTVVGDVPAELQAAYDKYAKMMPGAKAVDFDFYDAKGKKMTLSKLKGKAVYFDMWATWCGPCCAEIPYMEKLAEHYKGSKDIQIVSVSLDKNKDKWLKKLAADKPQWPQYIVNDELNCTLCKEYEINAIPRFMMFDKDGRIISINAPRPSSPDIIEWIDSNLKK